MDTENIFSLNFSLLLSALGADFFTPMAQVGIHEFDAKEILRRELPEVSGGAVHISEKEYSLLPKPIGKNFKETQSWITQEKLVAKPDQLFGKQGKTWTYWIKFRCLRSARVDYRESKKSREYWKSERYVNAFSCRAIYSAR